MKIGLAGMIPHNSTWITAEDREAVDSVLRSGWIAQGGKVRDLESAFNLINDGGESCFLSSGTAALAMALRGLNIASGMKVALPTYACSALLNAVYWVGAIPVPIDVRREDFILNHEEVPSDVDVVIVVNMFGVFAELNEFRKKDLKIIEDCCHSLGGRRKSDYKNTEADALIYSFYATKIISGGQGGLVWSRNRECISRIQDYRQFDCRIDFEPRFNFQNTDIHAALAFSQLSRLEEIRIRRAQIAERYLSVLPEGFSIQSKLMNPDGMIYRFVISAPSSSVRDTLFAHLLSWGIQCIIPVERYELLHRYMGINPGLFPVAEELAGTTISLPIYPSLADCELDLICTALRAF